MYTLHLCLASGREDVAKTDWIMVRIPRALHTSLMALAPHLADAPPKEQGNHEDNRSNTPPLHWVIATLLEREYQIRDRRRKNSVDNAAKHLVEWQKQLAAQKAELDAREKTSVYTARKEEHSETLADDFTADCWKDA